MKRNTAANERFGASGAVTRPKVCANLQVLCPCERQWKPRLRQAATTLGVILQTPMISNETPRAKLKIYTHKGMII